MKPALFGLFLVGLTAAGCGGGSARPQPPDLGISPPEDGTGAEQTVRRDSAQFVESVQDMLRGRVAGVEVVDLPECGGVTLRIRATAEIGEGSLCEREPLLIIDEKPVPLGHMADALRGLLPREIERIRVLKDVASTSVYGTRGAYGVILVSTRR